MHGAIGDDRRRFLSIVAAVIAGAGRCPDHRKRPDAGVRPAETDRRGCLEYRICRTGSAARPPGGPPSRVAVRHPQLRGRRAAAGVRRLQNDRAVTARLRNDAFSVARHVSKRPAGCAGRRYRRADGRARDRARLESDSREHDQRTPRHLVAHLIQRLAAPRCSLM